MCVCVCRHVWSSALFHGAQPPRSLHRVLLLTCARDLAGAGYLGGAVGRVLGHNFVGDETEPDWKETGRAGWSGDVHTKKNKDG